MDTTVKRALLIAGFVSAMCIVAAGWAAGVVAWSIRSYLRGPSL